ncbi:transferrin-like [Epargyreus clarus]|uniref:transferrin-like n=1 Tax=Epargyreus clarus TaxID=520877 RepID=UPI003C2BD99D
MGLRVYYFAVFVIGCVTAQQNFRVCIPAANTVLCQSLDRDGSQAICHPVESRVDCALRLASGAVDLGVFSEEETLLLAQQQPNDHRVVATIRDVNRQDLFAFEAVVVVRNNHTGGLEGLRGSRYCHPGLYESELRWSPRVLKTLERLAARTDRCPETPTERKTAEELEVETLSAFFSEACRPGPWSANATHDAILKSRHPNLCSLCGNDSTCDRYNLNMGVNVVGVSNDNRHIHALECLRSNGTVAFVAWQHVREFFNIRNPEEAASFSLLCEGGNLIPLTTEALTSSTSPCSFVKQPWSTIVASTARAADVQSSLRTWWPNGASPGTTGWQSILFGAIVGGSNVRVVFDDTLPTPANYSLSIRNITSMDATASCLPARRWCTLGTQEHAKCSWLRTAAYSLGIEPTISCQQRMNIFDCLADIKDNRADLIATPANYGFISRQHFNLSPVKLVQNSRNNPAAFSRVAALVKETVAQTEVTRFENLRDKRACFPEFGGIAYMAFVETAHARKVISETECDYARAVGEFFSGACAGGALDAAHVISESTYNATNLCTVCRSTTQTGNNTEFTCAWDSTNMYFGNRGALACLADPTTHVAFVEMQNINAHFTSLNLNPSDYRALCRNNTLAAFTGVNIDQGCLLAYVVDSEVLARRNDPGWNSLNALLDALDTYFGYNAATSTQLINLEIYSPFDGVSDLLFKDTAVGLSEPSLEAANEPSRNYIELFHHLESCRSAGAPPISFSNRHLYSIFTIFVMIFMTGFVVC